MTDIPSLNSILTPEFPVAQEHFAQLTPATLATDFVARPDLWFVYLKDAGVYQMTLADTCSRHEEQHLKDLATITDLQQKLYATQDKLIASIERTPSLPISSPRSTKHPDPAMFSGERTELEPFVTQLRTKLTLNDDHFDTETKKVFYASSRLEGTAMRQVMPHLKEDGSTDYKTVNELIQTLIVAFGDPDKKATAQRELRALKQKNIEFSAFIALFQRWAPDTGYEETTLISFLAESISSELKQASITLETPDTLAEYIATLQKLDNRLRAIATTNPFHKFSGRMSGTNSSVESIRAQSYASSPANKPNSTVSRSSSVVPSDSASNFGPMPMDLSHVIKGPVPPEEKLRRRTLGLCSYCGGQGHGAPTCTRFKCFNCGGIGHGAQGCTKPKKQRVQELSLIDVDPAEQQGKE